MAELQLTGCVVDLARHTVTHGEGAQALTPLEAALLGYLAERPGQAVAKATLLAEVWGYAPQVRTRALDVAVQRLRAKVEVDRGAPDHLLTVYGFGYRFEPVPGATSILPSLPRDALVGRAALLATVRAALEAGPGVITLTGHGGVGKTRVALAIAHGTATAIGMVDLSDAGTADAVASAVSRCLDTPPTGPDPVRGVGRELAERGGVLLVLDTLERAPHAAEVVARWTDMAPAATLLCTSRSALRIAGERTIDVPPLDADATAALFRARLDRAPSPDEAEHLAAVVQALDGLPLAVELAAARARGVPLSDLRDWAKRAGGTGPLAACLASSWDLLAPWGRQAMVQLASFPAGFGLAGARGVLRLAPDAPPPEDVLPSLVDASLLAFQPGAGGYRMLGLVARFAAAQGSPDEVAAAHRRHGAHAAAADPAVAVDLEVGCRRAVARGDADVAVACLRAASRLTHVHGGADAVAALADDVASMAPDVPAVVRRIQGEAAFRLGDLVGAEGALRDAVTRSADDVDERARALARLGTTLALAGRDEEASATLARVLALQTQHPDRPALVWASATARMRLGISHRHRGDLDAAMAAYRAASEGFRRAGDGPGAVAAAVNLGTALGEAGRLRECEAAYRSALDQALAIGNRRNQATSLGNLGLVRLHRGDGPAAIELLDDAVAVASALREPVVRGWLQAMRGDARLEVGELDAAAADLSAARDLLERLGEQTYRPNLRASLAKLAALEGHEDQAVRLLLDGRPGSHAHAEGELTLATLALEAGNVDQARDLLDALRARGRSPWAAVAGAWAAWSRRRGSPSDAMAEVVRARGRLDASDHRIHWGIVGVLEARLRAEAGDAAGAREALESARNVLVGLGPLADRSPLGRRVEAAARVTPE